MLRFCSILIAFAFVVGISIPRQAISSEPDEATESQTVDSAEQKPVTQKGSIQKKSSTENGNAGTQDQTRPKPEHGANKQEEIQKLINQLGSDEFPLREQAEIELQDLGKEALIALRKATITGDLEIRLRSKRLLGSFEQQQLEHDLNELISDEKGIGDGLPYWSQFRKIGGFEKSARQLYVSIVRQEPAILKAITKEQQNIVDEYARLVQKVYNSSIRDSKITDETDLAILLLLGADPVFLESISETTNETILPLRLKTILSGTRGAASIVGATNAVPLMRLLRNWIVTNAKNEELVGYMVKLGLRYGFRRESLRIARRNFKDPQKKINAGARSISYLAIAKLGNREDCELILEGLRDEQVCHTWHNGETRVETQVRDVALLCLIHLTEQNPKDFGFDLLRSDSVCLYSEFSIGFPTEKSRQTSFEKWERWLAENPF